MLLVFPISSCHVDPAQPYTSPAPELLDGAPLSIIHHVTHKLQPTSQTYLKLRLPKTETGK